MRKGVLSREHTFILILVVSLLLIGILPLYSQESPGKIGVASATFRQGIEDSPLFGPVISGIVSFELSEAGFHPESFSVESAVDSAFDRAAEAGMDLLLINSYTAKGDEIVLTVSCYYVPEKRLLTDVSGRGDINLALDGVIQRMLQEIIAEVEGKLDELPGLAVFKDTPEPEPEIGAGQTDERSTDTGSTDGEDKVSESTGAETGAADREKSPEVKPGPPEKPVVVDGELIQLDPETEDPVLKRASAEKFRHFELSLGFSPYFPVGSAANYFTVGFEPWLYSGYRFRAGSSSLTLGAYAGLTIFTAEGVLISSENMLLSTGLDLRLLISEANILRVGFRLAGGSAFFMVNPNDQGYQTAVVPFGSGGLSIDIGLGAIGLAFQFNFTAYFEQSINIMGFSPGVQISLRL